MIKLESDVKRLKCDLQLSRNRENELRDQIVCYMSRCSLGLNLKISLCTIFVFQRALAQVRDIIAACGEIGTGVADQQSDLDSRWGEADLEQLGEEAR